MTSWNKLKSKSKVQIKLIKFKPNGLSILFDQDKIKVKCTACQQKLRNLKPGPLQSIVTALKRPFFSALQGHPLFRQIILLF